MNPWRTAALALALATASVAHGQNCCVPRLDDEDRTSADLIGGLQAATALLMGVPAVLAGGIGLWFIRRQRPSEADPGECGRVESVESPPTGDRTGA